MAIPPAMGGYGLGSTLYKKWQWHPVFAILAGLITFLGQPLILYFSWSLFGEATFLVGAVFCYGIEAWLISSYSLDNIWSVTIGIVCELMIYPIWKLSKFAFFEI
jgi:hypothetical protein